MLPGENFSDPSFDAPELTSSDLPYDIVATHKTLAHAIVPVGSGTIDVVTAAGEARTWTTRDGVPIICAVSSIAAFGGSTTAVRVHIPAPRAQAQQLTS